jgi:hypothetical protein
MNYLKWNNCDAGWIKLVCCHVFVHLKSAGRYNVEVHVVCRVEVCLESLIGCNSGVSYVQLLVGAVEHGGEGSVDDVRSSHGLLNVTESVWNAEVIRLVASREDILHQWVAAIRSTVEQLLLLDSDDVLPVVRAVGVSCGERMLMFVLHVRSVVSLPYVRCSVRAGDLQDAT